MQRIRVRFRKTGPLVAISHLDLMRAFERALRRAALPLRMTEGFNPHPRLSFPVPLAVGIAGLDEVMEFDLADWVAPEDIRRRLGAQLPEGLDLISLAVASPQETARALSIEYTVTALGDLAEDPRLSPDALRQFLARPEIPLQRRRKGKDKTVNIRPFILAAELRGPDVVLHLTAGPQGSAHPEEILGALGLDMSRRRSRLRTTRTRVRLAN